MRDRAKTGRGAPGAAAATAFLQSACERLPIGFALFDAKYRLVAASARFGALRGYPRKRLKTGTPLESFVRFDAERGEYGAGAVDAVTRTRLAALKRGRPAEREQAQRDGRIVRIACECLPEGGLALTCEDVTDARRTAERLRESEERYDFAMRAINEGVYDWDIAGGTIYYSDRVRAVLGLSPKELRTPAAFLERVHPDDLPRLRAAFAAHFKGETERFECDYRYRTHDGAWGWWRQHGVALRDARGRAYRMIGSAGNITELKERERQVAEQAAEQRAVREVLEAISRSAFDLDAVLRTLVESATRLCRAEKGFIFRLDGDVYRLAVDCGGVTPELREFELQHPVRPGRESLVGRTALTKQVVHLEDVLADREYRLPEAQRIGGFRTMLGVPIVRDETVIGVIALWKERVEPFTPAQIALVTTFSNQASIAIENARLFGETKEALEQQTATAEILRLISTSPTDLQPVLDGIAGSAARLCEARDSSIFRVAGDVLDLVAAHTEFPIISPGERLPIDQGLVLGRAVLGRRLVHVPDLASAEAQAEFPESAPRQRRYGTRTILAMPLLHEGTAIGAILIRRLEVRPFTDKQISLLKTFADQAVIAIENVRLFNETKEALEKQTAISEILRVISASPTDVQPVFETILRSAVTLCGSATGGVFRYDGERLHFVAGHEFRPERLEALRSKYPLRPDLSTISGRAILAMSVARSDDVLADPQYDQAHALKHGLRRMVAVPMLRDGVALGVIVVSWPQPGTTPKSQVDLLRTFADQAVIAIENVRLFNELEARNRELTESLEQQMATAEILRVISSSPTDIQPVLESVATTAARLCDASDAVIFRIDGSTLRIAARHGSIPAPAADDLIPINRDTVNGRSVVDRGTIHVHDLAAAAETEFPLGRTYATRLGYRTALAAPLLREGQPVGTIHIRRREARPFSDRQIRLLETFAHQAAIAIENVRLFNETKEALEQQTATAEILKVISASPTDVQPVFEAIVRSGVRLFENAAVAVVRPEHDQVRLMAIAEGDPRQANLWRSRFPFPLTREYMHGAAILDCETVDVSDMLAPIDRFEAGKRNFLPSGYRAITIAPMVRDGTAIGAISVIRISPGSLTDKQLALLKTFADQAVIAIENVRLFNETKEALDQLKASAEVLQVISSSVADTKPVFETILESCERLFEGRFAGVGLAGHDGAVHLGAYRGPGREALEKHFPVPLSEESGSGMTILQRRVIHYPDVEGGEDVPEYMRRGAKISGYKSVILAPMLWEGRGIGVIFVGRDVVGEFSEKEIALLKTFADQAVIAIQNARLFNETKEALERQTATAEILKVISESPTDVQPVFDAIVSHAGRLAPGCSVNVSRIVGDQLHLAAYTRVSPEADEALKSFYPIGIGEVRSTIAEAVRSRTSFLVSDHETDPRVSPKARAVMRARGFRSTLYMPLVRGDVVYGVMHVSRVEPGPFPEEWMSLLKTFADQAVIAIENVRLFNETKEALEQQTATADILKVMSASPTDVQPVFDAIASSGVRLFQGVAVSLRVVKGDRIERVAFAAAPGCEVSVDSTNAALPLDDRSFAGRAVLQRKLIHVPDIPAADWVGETSRTANERMGARAIAVAPMLRENKVLGAIAVTRARAGPFSGKDLALLTTFADQAVIAIENVRLFNETKEALEQLKASAEVLQVISSSVADTKPVFDKILESCERLFVGQHVGINLIGEDGAVHLGPYRGARRPELERIFPLPLSHESASGSAILERRVMHYPDMEHGADVPEGVRRAAKTMGFKSVIFAPMLWEGRGIGTIWVNREFAGPFSDKEIGLLKTFADQAVIAIQNAKLFHEIQEKSHQLEIANQHKSAFLANMSHELRTPLNAVIGFSEMLSARYFGDLTGKQAEYVNDIHGSGKHLLSLINDILDLSKIEAGRMELEEGEFDLRAALDNALTLVRERAQRSGVALRLETDPALGAFRGDERKLKQVVLNLLSNAVKFTPRGGAVGVVARQANGSAEIAVSDTGVGIAPRDQEAIFEAFRQVGTDVTRKREGTGLGLALSRRFVELHGGTIRVESEPGKGSKFTVTLPLRHGQ